MLPLIASAFAVIVGLIIYFLIGERMYSKPILVLACAFVVLLLPPIFMAAIASAADSIAKIHPGQRPFTELLTGLQFVILITSGLGGALIGMAVSRKAAILHDAKVRHLKIQLDGYRKEIRKFNASIKELEGAKQSISVDEYNSRKHSLQNMLITTVLDTHDVEWQLEEYGV